MRHCLLVAVFLTLAASAQAQNTIPRAASNTPYWGSGGGWRGDGGSSSGINSAIGRPVEWEPPREYSVDYATNDGPFIPSTYMEYDEALELGRRLLAAQQAKADVAANHAVSLGEAAHALRIARVPTLRLKSRVLQDNSGHLHLCNLNGNDCRPI